MMRVLAIGSDRSIFDPGSASRARQEGYAKALGNLDIIVFSRPSDRLSPFEKGGLRAYPTNALSKLLQVWYAVHIAKRIPKPDVITAQDPFEAGFIAWLIAGLQGVPLHIQVHTDFLSPEFAKLSILNRLRTWIAGFVLRRAARIRVVSAKIKQSLEAIYAIKKSITVLSIYVDVEKFRSTTFSPSIKDVTAKFKYRLLVVARNAPEKNIELAVESFKKGAPQDACLLIASSTIDKHILRSDDRIISAGNVKPEHLYPGADLVLVPSKYEGYGLVIVEALAAGKPVLSTDVGVAREAGAIITKESEFAEALTAWFKNGPRHGELKVHPYKSFEEYVEAYCSDIASCVPSGKTQ